METSTWGGGEAYERYVGRWSRPVGRQFLDWLEVAPGARWLDVGCGTGALSGLILAFAGPSSVTGVDSSDGFIGHARARLVDPRAAFRTGDARDLPVESASVDAVVSGLMLNFVPEPALAVVEMARVLAPGGTAGVYVWDYRDGMQFMRRFWDAAAEVDPNAAERDEGRRFDGVCNPQALLDLFAAAGFRDIETRGIEIPTTFVDFDDFWSPFLGGQGAAPTYVMALDEPARDRLRERLRETMPVAGDGSIRLTARAWAVKGTR